MKKALAPVFKRVSNEELKPYVLKCVNDELEAEGYKKVKDVQI